MTPRPGDIAAVLWMDACFSAEWDNVQEHARSSGKVVVTMGLILRYDKVAVCIAGSVDTEGMASEVTTVPRSLIMHTYFLKRPRRSAHRPQ